MSKNEAPQHSDISAIAFVKEMLGTAPDWSVNFDRLMYQESTGQFFMFEFQRCESTKDVNPWTSHPNYYWPKVWRKYNLLWRAVKRLRATFYVVNFAEPNTNHADKILVYKVKTINHQGMTSEAKKFTRLEFKDWFNQKNKECESKQAAWEMED